MSTNDFSSSKNFVNLGLLFASIEVEDVRAKGSGDVDFELVERARRGDREAFDELVLRHQEVVFRIAYGMLGNREDALDVVQETFFRAYRSLKRFRGESSFRFWVERIATRLCVSRYRRRRVFVELGAIFGLGKSFAFDERIDAQRGVEALGDALGELSPKERAAFTLRMEGHSIAQISDVLGVAQGTVKSLLHRAVQKLRKALMRRGFDGIELTESDLEG